MASPNAPRSAWPETAGGHAESAMGPRKGAERGSNGHGVVRGCGGYGGSGVGVGRSRGGRSPTILLEGLHRSEGCFVTPEKVRKVMQFFLI